MDKKFLNVNIINFENVDKPKGGTMGHFRKSSYAYLFLKSGTILTTITSTTSIHKGKATTVTINAKKHLSHFSLLHTKGKVSPLLEGLESSFWGQIGVEFNFQSTLAHYRCRGRIRATTTVVCTSGLEIEFYPNLTPE